MAEVRTTLDVFQYFKTWGINTLSRDYYRRIDEWMSWYRGNVAGFTFYRMYTGHGNYVRQRRHSLGMAKQVCEDMANLLLNERVTMVLSDSRTGDFVHRVLQSVGFDQLGNRYQERKAACGTVAYVPYIAAREIDPVTGLVMDGAIKMRYATAQNIYPISWDNGKITEVAFAFWVTYLQQTYLHMQLHQLDGGGEYVITNKILAVVPGSTTGTELTEAEWRQLPPFAEIDGLLYTGSREPQFVIDRLNIVNNAMAEGDDCPLGVALFANSIDTLRKIDTEYDSYANEFILGRKRILAKPEMLQDDNGNPVFDANDTVFYLLPEDDGGAEGKPLQEINMELRTQDHSRAINDDLNFLSLKCGFGSRHYRFDGREIKTATEVISENSDLYRTVCKHEIPLRAALTELARIIIRLGIALGQPLDPAADITIHFDDSIIEDKAAERQTDREDVALGALGLAEYRAKWRGETIRQAAAHLPHTNTAREPATAPPAAGAGREGAATKP